MSFAQGDIIRLNLDPTKGHEQAGYRLAIVISRKVFNQKTGLLTICPISSPKRTYPTWVLLSGSIATQGFVLCEHVKTIDAAARNPKLVEKADDETLDCVLAGCGSLEDLCRPTFTQNLVDNLPI